MKKTATVLVLSALTLTLGACASQRNDIDESNVSAIKLGVSSLNDVKSHVSGGRMYENDITINGQPVHYLSYFHSKGAAFYGVEGKMRYLSYLFYNDKLVGIEKSSRFDEDSTDFDVDKAKTIKNGMTRQQVVGILGNPSGEFIYPIAKNPGDTGIAYYNIAVRPVPFAGSLQTDHEARISLNNNNEVDDVFVEDKTSPPSLSLFGSAGER